MTKFEDHLFEDLMSDHGDELDTLGPPPARRAVPRRAIAAGGGAIAVAGVLAVAITTFGTTASPAYAVTTNADGTVTVSIEDIEAIGPANAKLRELGVRAKAVPTRPGCADLDEKRMYGGSDWTIEQDENGSVTLGQDLPAGYTVLLTVSDRPGRGTGLGFTGPVKDPAPSCLLDPADVRR